MSDGAYCRVLPPTSMSALSTRYIPAESPVNTALPSAPVTAVPSGARASAAIYASRLSRRASHSASEVYVASLNGDLTKTVEVKLSQSVYDWQYHDTITFDDISHSKGDGDSANWKGVPGKNGTCVVYYDENAGVVLKWSGDKIGPNINYSEDLRGILDKTGFLTTYNGQTMLEVDSNSGSTPMKKEIEKYMGENSLLKYGTWAFLADPKNSINSSTPYSYVFWTCVDTNKVGVGVKIPVIIAKPNGTYCISDSTTAKRNNKYVGDYVAIADHIGSKNHYDPYVNGKTEYTSLEEAYKEYEKYVGQEYPTYKEDLPK